MPVGFERRREGRRPTTTTAREEVTIPTPLGGMRKCPLEVTRVQ
jgi:hypothetical protein